MNLFASITVHVMLLVSEASISLVGSQGRCTSVVL